jgi:hypothetical protein
LMGWGVRKLDLSRYYSAQLQAVKSNFYEIYSQEARPGRTPRYWN